MKLFIKDGKFAGKSIKLNNRLIINPTEELLIAAGYTEYVAPVYVEPELTNEDIKKQREYAYEARADKYLLAYQAYKELGDEVKASDMKILWLAEREKIDAEYPYKEEA